MSTYAEAKEHGDLRIGKMWLDAMPAIIFGKEAVNYMALGVTKDTAVSGGRVIDIRRKRDAASAHEQPKVGKAKDQQAAEDILKGFLDNDEAMDAEVGRETVYLSEQDCITLLRRGIAAGRIFAREERLR